MKPAPFAYVRPASLEEALAALADDPGAKVLAGGQSLVPLLSMRLAAPGRLVDINALPDLAHVRSSADGVRVGALARHADVGQVGQRVDVDEPSRCGEPHREQRHQALAAGQHLGTGVVGQGGQRLLEGRRPHVGERGGLHSAFVTSSEPRSDSVPWPRFTRW